MELSWLMKLRIAAAVATGVVLIGLLAWQVAVIPDSLGALSLSTGAVTLGGAITLAGLAFLAGFISYFICWPYGREIGVLAVPAGLSVWAVRCGSMAGLMQLKPTLSQRQALFAMLRWEPIFWLAIVAAGFAGVLLAQKTHARSEPTEAKEKSKSNLNKCLNAIIALVGSVLIVQFCITLFAQDVKTADNQLGSVLAQPAIGQVVFAVLVSYGLAAFVVKIFLNVSYVWPTIASALVTPFAISTYVRQDVLAYLVQRWPAPFFSNAVISILPLQMVAFGTLGAIIGYWLGVRYNYWRKHG